MEHKQLRRAVLLAVCLCLLAGCGKKDKEETPEETSNLLAEYPVGEQTVAALTTEESGVTMDSVVTYTYSGLSSAGTTAQDYAGQLRGSESGFSIVDEEYVKTDAPDFTQPEGEVLLAKNLESTAAPEGGGEDKEGEGEASAPPAEDMVLYVRVSWSEGTCVVSADEAPGKVTAPPPTPAPPPGLSMMEAEDYFKSLSPADLGLPGESMEDFSIYTMSGAVLVDGNPCVRMNVYSNDNPQHTNELVGCFLMNGNGTHLYRLDTATNTVEELDIVRH